FAELEYVHDAGVAQACEDLGFAHEHPEEALVARVLGQHELDHYGLDEPHGALGAREVHHTHAPFGQLSHDAITAEQHGTDQIVGDADRLGSHGDPAARLR